MKTLCRTFLMFFPPSYLQLVLHMGEQISLAWLRSYVEATSHFANIKVSTCVLVHGSLHTPSFLAQVEVNRYSTKRFVWLCLSIGFTLICPSCVLLHLSM